MKRAAMLVRLYLTLAWHGFKALALLPFVRLGGADRVEPFFLARAGRWARGTVAIAGGRVRVEGADKVPADGAVLYVANHQGALDIPIMMGYLPGAPAFVAKKELFSIPILGYWMRRLGCVVLDRENARTARDQLRDGAARVKAGRRLVLFPEGTRSRDPEGRMGSFKRGSFKLATLSGAVVVPVTVEGSRFLLSPVWPAGFDGEVRLIVSDPIPVAAMDEEARRGLPDQIHALIDDTRARHHLGAIPEHAVAP